MPPYRDSSNPVVCRCGHDRGHYMVSPEADYTVSGYVRLAFGISARPTRVRFRCRRCQQVIEDTTDPAILDEHY